MCVGVFRKVCALTGVLVSSTNKIDRQLIIEVLLKVALHEGVDVVEWSRALDVRLSEWCCSVSMMWIQIPSREEQKFDSSKI